MPSKWVSRRDPSKVVVDLVQRPTNDLLECIGARNANALTAVRLNLQELRVLDMSEEMFTSLLDTLRAIAHERLRWNLTARFLYHDCKVESLRCAALMFMMEFNDAIRSAREGAAKLEIRGQELGSKGLLLGAARLWEWAARVEAAQGLSQRTNC